MAGVVRAADPLRPVSAGLAAPRLRAKHLAETPGGGLNCVNAANPKGDCDGYCPGIAFDSQDDSVAAFEAYYGGGVNGTVASVHWYSCDPPNGNYCKRALPGHGHRLPLLSAPPPFAPL